MKKNNILLLVDNLSLVEKLKHKKGLTFLFPIADFCVGFAHPFKLSDIQTEGYIFLNRLFDNNDIAKLKKFLLTLPSNIKGIVFDDIGILNILISSKINIEKILFLNHFNCNIESINTYLKYVDSIVVSTDITLPEIKNILSLSFKPLVLYVFGHVNIMYSRRTLLTNYNNYFHKKAPSLSFLEEEISHKKFKIIENDYGTVIYTESPFNGLALRGQDNVLYELINTVFLSDTEVIEILNSKNNMDRKYPYKYLSEEKTIVKIKEDKNA